MSDTPFRDACIAYDAARREVAVLTKVIGDRKHDCFLAQIEQGLDVESTCSGRQQMRLIA